MLQVPLRAMDAQRLRTHASLADAGRILDSALIWKHSKSTRLANCCSKVMSNQITNECSMRSMISAVGCRVQVVGIQLARSRMAVG